MARLDTAASDANLSIEMEDFDYAPILDMAEVVSATTLFGFSWNH